MRVPDLVDYSESWSVPFACGIDNEFYCAVCFFVELYAFSHDLQYLYLLVKKNF